MKTTLYIDGFNLYYGSLRGTAYKWLDIVKLFSLLANEQNHTTQIVKVKFFTAPIKAKIATKGQLAFKSQNDYHRALTVLYPQLIEIIEGYFSLEKGLLPAYENPIDKSNKVSVWKLEEKQTDVNIALHLYDDVIHKKCEQVILVSNDSDLLPALQFSRKVSPEIIIGTIIPRILIEHGNKRPGNSKLSAFSDWTRGHINESEFKSSQLPNVVQTKRRAIFKPKYW